MDTENDYDDAPIYIPNVNRAAWNRHHVSFTDFLGGLVIGAALMGIVWSIAHLVLKP